MAGDRVKAVIQAALDPALASMRCIATVETVISIMGSEAGSLGSKCSPWAEFTWPVKTAVHLEPVLKSPRFLQPFRRKGRFAELMSRIPVHLRTNKVGSPAPPHMVSRGLVAKTTAGLRRAS